VFEVIECGNQFPLGEITGRAKDHQDARRTYVRLILLRVVHQIVVSEPRAIATGSSELLEVN